MSVYPVVVTADAAAAAAELHIRLSNLDLCQITLLKQIPRRLLFSVWHQRASFKAIQLLYLIVWLNCSRQQQQQHRHRPRGRSVPEVSRAPQQFARTAQVAVFGSVRRKYGPQVCSARWEGHIEARMGVLNNSRGRPAKVNRP